MEHLISAQFRDPEYRTQSLEYRIRSFYQKIRILQALLLPVISKEIYDIFWDDKQDYYFVYVCTYIVILFEIIRKYKITTITQFHITIYSVWLFSVIGVLWEETFKHSRMKECVFLACLANYLYVFDKFSMLKLQIRIGVFGSSWMFMIVRMCCVFKYEDHDYWSFLYIPCMLSFMALNQTFDEGSLEVYRKIYQRS